MVFDELTLVGHQISEAKNCQITLARLRNLLKQKYTQEFEAFRNGMKSVSVSSNPSSYLDHFTTFELFLNFPDFHRSVHELRGSQRTASASERLFECRGRPGNRNNHNIIRKIKLSITQFLNRCFGIGEISLFLDSLASCLLEGSFKIYQILK